MSIVTVTTAASVAILTPPTPPSARAWRAIQGTGLSASVPFFGALAITNVA